MQLSKPILQRLKFAVGALTAIICAYFSFFLATGTSFPNDWNYFNSLSLVLRSVVLGYHRLPLQNPWICGGLDLLTNPQSRVFSPLFLLDLAFSPQWANLLSLVLYGLLGFIGMVKLLLHLGVRPLIAFFGAVLFLNCSWFGLHFAEGHIPYGSMQLIPWVAYFGLSLEKASSILGIFFLLAVYLLDGGIYSFIFSLFVLGTTLALDWKSTACALAHLFRNRWWWLGSVVGSVLLSAPKIIPLWVGIRERIPYLDYHEMSLGLFVRSLFYPFQVLGYQSGFPQPEGFHEYGCYFSLLGLSCICFHFFKKRYARENYPFLLALGFWLWIGSGLLPKLNPWVAFQKISLFNNAHLQSRVFIISYLFFILLLCRAVNESRKNLRLLTLMMLLLLESAFIRNYPVSKMPTLFGEVPARLIASSTIVRTVPYAFAMNHYLDGDMGTASCYEPSYQPRHIAATGSMNYRGEIYAEPPSDGLARIEEYTPGRIRFIYKILPGARLILNTNALYGWKVESGKATLRGRADDLLEVFPHEKEGEIRLSYFPDYLYGLFPAYVIGGLIFLGLFLTWLRKKSPGGSAHRSFDYSHFPEGYYDQVAEKGFSIQRAWHRQKFSRIEACLPKGDGLSILDIGCFAGTFLSRLNGKWFSEQVGVDVLPEQIRYARRQYGCPYRKFTYLSHLSQMQFKGKFDCVTLIEVVEHLSREDIVTLLAKTYESLKPGGKLILSTPNYTSMWPALEVILNNFSGVSYEEQHISPFYYFNMIGQLKKVYPLLGEQFEVEFVTTTHFISPFVGLFSQSLSDKVCQMRDHQNWKFPFGNLIIVSLVKRKVIAKAA